MGNKTRIEDSLKKRYFYKLGTKVVGVPIAIVTASIVPRALGVNAYGNFNFITDFFNRLVGFVDASTSNAFYHKLSQRPKESALISFYWGYFSIISVIMVFFVATVFMINKQGSIWINQESRFIWLGLLWGLLSWLNQIVYKIVDAYGLTVKGELAVIKQRLFALCFLGVLFILGKVDLLIFFVYHFFMFFLMFFLWWQVLKKSDIRLFPLGHLNKSLIKKYSSEFYQFSMPLFIGGILTLPLGFADRWLLQMFGGSVEQGLYSLAFKVGSICLIFTSSLVPLFHREISKAYGDNRHDEMRRLFLRFVPMLYSVAVCISAFFFFQSDKVSIIIGGESFKGAVIPMSIMSLYPIHQTFGQLNSAVYFAMAQTRLYRNIGISIMVIGLLVTYLLLAPKEQLGLNLGSTGLALKMVLVQIVGQNILLWFNTRSLKISFIKMLSHQFISVLIIGAAAGLSTYISNNIVDNIVLSLISAGSLYMAFLLVIIYLFPSLFSIKRGEIVQNIRLIKQRFIREIKK